MAIVAGQKYGRLTALHVNGRGNYWVFMCDCGKRHVADGRNVSRGTTKSCGCYNKERIRKSKPKSQIDSMVKASNMVTHAVAVQRVLESHNATDITVLMVDTLNDVGTVAKMAQKLGISKAAAHGWLNRYNIVKKWGVQSVEQT